MSLKYINNSKYVNKIEELYLNSFPEDERFPFWILQECSKENNSDLYAILDNDKMIGMCYIVNCTNAYYLMYLAVVPSLRNKNYGSMILRDLKEKYKVLFLSVDVPVDNISVRQAIEKFDFYKFSVVPVIDENGKYINSISEGDLLCFIKNNNPISLKDLEKIPLFEVPRYRTYECLSISSTFDEILNLSLNQNFIPIIDDRGMFIGIIKRKDIIKHLLELTKEHK